MGTLHFKDGVSINTDGSYRITRRSDGLYVIGQGMLMPIDSREEGEEIIRELTGDDDEVSEEKGSP